MSDRPQADLEALLRGLEQAGVEVPSGRASIDWFGDGPEMARELGSLVRRGLKTTTAGLLRSYEAEGEDIPKAGDVSLVVDWAGALLAVIETTDVTVLPFRDVGAEHARDEGEGDLSLAYWRRVHWEFFERECRRLGREPSESMPVMCERFRLLYAAPAVAEE